MFSIACHVKETTRYGMVCQGLLQSVMESITASQAGPDPTGRPPPKAQTGSMRGYRCTNFHEC